jgi:chemotaxis protein CheD
MVYLEPGEICLAEEPTQISTVLGSCLAVTMWIPRLKFGAICHAFLPRCQTWESCHGPCRERFKYVYCTIPWMVEELRRLGGRRLEIEVKLFGGSDRFLFAEEEGSGWQAGRENAATALSLLKKEGLSVAVQDLGGAGGRKIIFDTGTGEVLLKRIKPQSLRGPQSGLR